VFGLELLRWIKAWSVYYLGFTGLARVDMSLELLSLKEDVTINAYHGLEVPDDGISTFHPLGRYPNKQKDLRSRHIWIVTNYVLPY